MTQVNIEEGMVWGFARPHEAGTICGFPCNQCGPGEAIIVGAHGERLPDTPFFIVAPATQEDWCRSNRQRGGAGIPGLNARHYYFVRTD